MECQILGLKNAMASTVGRLLLLLFVKAISGIFHSLSHLQFFTVTPGFLCICPLIKGQINKFGTSQFNQ
jgi:hypothetical protein